MAKLKSRRLSKQQPWRIAVAEVAVDEVDALPAANRARLARIDERVQQLGLPAVTEPHVKHLKGKVWEFRLGGEDTIARALYVTRDRVAWIVRAFVKKTMKTPKNEIELAERRAKELELI
jgi:phage-related protein